MYQIPNTFKKTKRSADNGLSCLGMIFCKTIQIIFYNLDFIY